MCLHTKRDIENALNSRDEDTRWAVVWWELYGEPKFGADCVEFQDSGAVMRSLEWLRECHPQEFAGHPVGAWTANLSDVNGKRALIGALLIDEHGNELPPEAQVAGFITTAERGAAHA